MTKEIDKTKKTLPTIKPFNDHQSPQCKGHANFMLDCTYETIEEREQIVKSISNYL